ncbi:uncharacterized protein LOC116295806 [Actinia tenebrosa]|uniref:Uncharacterized protein LOC116295806 n=1 Tax=Actinia tenebrosa TaxID=6105 RepID=A0A6P8HT84_ACTTE|nr:uncharacterized protein LOC116295806 [Actinia tenebrosa]
MVACSKIQNIFLRLLDYLIVCTFISPLVIYYWQGTWMLMDFYILPGSILDSALLSTGLGVIFSHFILGTQGWMVEKLSIYNKVYLQIAWKICIYLISLSTISFWRGVWMLMDMFAGVTLTVFLVSHGMAFIFLTATRTTSSIVFCPGYLLKDQTTSPSTSFNFDAIPLINCIKNKSIQIFISHFVTVFIISTAIVCYWRGTWNLAIYVANMSVGTGLYTCVATTSFGYVVSLFCFIINQPLERKLTGNSLSWPYLIKAFLEHVFVYVLGFAAVNVWSGLWCLGDHFFIIPGQENNHLSALLRHCISFLALHLAQGTINLVGAPAGCRTHGRNTLEGLFMGTYFIFSGPNMTGKRIEVSSRSTETKENGNENNKTQTEPNMNDGDSNATRTDPDVIGNENKATYTELNLIGNENNTTHIEPKINDSDSNALALNSNENNTAHIEPNLNDSESNVTHTEGKMAETDVTDGERNAVKENEDAEHDVTGNEDNAIDTATEPKDIDNDINSYDN